MTANLDRDPDELVDVARVLVLVQGAVLVTSTIEAGVFASAFAQGGGASVLLTGLAAGATLTAGWGLGRRARWARRLTYLGEAVVLVGAIVDQLLALILAGAPLGLVPALMRLIVPMGVVVLLRRSRRQPDDNRTTENRTAEDCTTEYRTQNGTTDMGAPDTGTTSPLEAPRKLGRTRIPGWRTAT